VACLPSAWKAKLLYIPSVVAASAILTKFGFLKTTDLGAQQ